jgi:enoyl-CoA hydratase/carnithine racemase
MEAELIDLRIQSGIATLHLNRPDKRNAMNDELREQLTSALERINGDRNIRALILTGNGKAFCAGGDVAAMAKRFDTPLGEIGFNGWSRQQHVHYAQSLLHTLPIPTIAAVNGPCAGLGADIALACDFVIASNAASFAWSYINRGLIPDGGGMYLLPRRVGLPKAKELIFSGRKVDADEALHMGIADRLSSPEALLADAQAWAIELSGGSRTALALGKTILNQSFELSAEQTFTQGSQAQGICYTSTEHRESVMNFLEKSAVRQDDGREMGKGSIK